ncbi:glycosyl hydrolase [Plectosphaerella plurivora]|uniref:Glycosyl hydrolase n=1 Tax=Plectosphaerella plurivora TaxID=936078 RepID=A0A9P9A253_9PEZI|nr:glycosyl hydrolase [Plectosphaerella plurivora]
MKYSNPIVPGFAPDPSIVLVDGVFYLATSSFHLFPGIPIYASRDLQAWTHIGNAILRAEQLKLSNASTMPVPLRGGDSMLGCGGLFAPTIRHHDGRFYIICTNASTTPAFKVDNFFVWTDDIWHGAWSDPIFFPFRGIDPSLFFEGGRAYVQGSFSLGMDRHPSCTIKQFGMDMETGELLTEPVEIWAGHSRIDTEGPHIYRKDGYYYLVVAEGGTFEHHMLSIARSEDLWGPYEGFDGNPIMTSDGKPGEYIQNIGHGELVEDASGQWWAVVLGVRKADGSHPLGRETFLAPVTWPEGGWPVISQPKASWEGPAVNPGSVPHDGIMFEERVSRVPDSIGWLYIRDPEPQCYTLPDQNGRRITLRPSLADMSRPTGTCTFVGKRQRTLEVVVETTLQLATVRSGEAPIVTGLAVYKHHLHHLSLRYDAKAGRVTFHGFNGVTGLDADGGPSLHVGEIDGVLHLKMEATATEYRGFACTAVSDGVGESARAWKDLGSFETAAFTANEMTGPTLGVFASCTEEMATSTDLVFDELHCMHVKTT